jgi:hypothetical protein
MQPWRGGYRVAEKELVARPARADEARTVKPALSPHALLVACLAHTELAPPTPAEQCRCFTQGRVQDAPPGGPWLHHLFEAIATNATCSTKCPRRKNGGIDMWVRLTGLMVYVIFALTFLKPNKNSKWLCSCLQMRSRAILFSESRTERLYSLKFLKQMPPNRRGSNINDFNLPKRSTSASIDSSNHLFDEELCYDTDNLLSEYENMIAHLNIDQCHAFDCIVDVLLSNKHVFFFVSGLEALEKFTYGIP